MNENREENEKAAPHAELVAAAIAGEPAAADELLARLAPQLVRWLEGQMGTRLKRYLPVADVAQESLASLLTSLGHLREGAGLDDARRLLFQHARWIVMRKGSDAGKFDGESVCQELHRQERQQDIDRSLGDVTLEDELCWLNELIEELEEDLRVVLRSRLEGATFAELGEQLQLSESAVRKRFERGLDELQRLGEARKREA